SALAVVAGAGAGARDSLGGGVILAGTLDGRGLADDVVDAGSAGQEDQEIDGLLGGIHPGVDFLEIRRAGGTLLWHRRLRGMGREPGLGGAAGDLVRLPRLLVVGPNSGALLVRV